MPSPEPTTRQDVAQPRPGGADRGMEAPMGVYLGAGGCSSVQTRCVRATGAASQVIVTLGESWARSSLCEAARQPHIGAG